MLKMLEVQEKWNVRVYWIREFAIDEEFSIASIGCYEIQK